MENLITEHQETIFNEVTDDGHTCPQCKEEGGQHLQIENAGDSWTQIYCCYCREYLNLDEFINQKKQDEF